MINLLFLLLFIFFHVSPSNNLWLADMKFGDFVGKIVDKLLSPIPKYLFTEKYKKKCFERKAKIFILPMCTNDLKWLNKVLSMVFVLCLMSCDTASMLYIDDMPYYDLSTECGKVKITGKTLFVDYITLCLNGDFEIIPDSFIVKKNNLPVDKSEVRVYHRNKLESEIQDRIHINGNDTIYIYIKDTLPLKYSKHGYLEIFPSSFLLCNDSPVIKNVIKMVR